MCTGPAIRKDECKKNAKIEKPNFCYILNIVFLMGGGSGKSAKNTRIEREWFNLIMSRETYQTQAKRFPEICQFSLASNSSFSKMGTPKSINNERPKTRTQKVSRLWLKAVHLKRHAFGVKQNGCSCEKS